MDNRIFNKASFSSRYVTDGTSRAPRRSYVSAMGLTREQIHPSLTGFVSSWCEASAGDMSEAGGAASPMKTRLARGFLPGDCLTVTGRMVNGNLSKEKLRKVVRDSGQDVIPSPDKPMAASGGAVDLGGNLAPDGAIVEGTGMPEAALTFKEPALCFDREEAARRRRDTERCVFVIRCGGLLSTAAALDGQGTGSQGRGSKVASLVTNGRLSGGPRSFCVGHVGPAGGRQRAKRKKVWQPRKTNSGSHALTKHKRGAGLAVTVVVTLQGALSETNVYADF